jgi:hypothetical protein
MVMAESGYKVSRVPRVATRKDAGPAHPGSQLSQTEMTNLIAYLNASVG